jgi:hypothetical protein
VSKSRGYALGGGGFIKVIRGWQSIGVMRWVGAGLLRLSVGGKVSGLCVGWGRVY